VKALAAIGGRRPLGPEELARRAHQYTLQPTRNPVKVILDQAPTLSEAAPLLGIFNDIPWHRFRESEATAWATAGFSFIVNDAEHSPSDGLYGIEQNSVLGRLGLLAVQRLPREEVSGHGDALSVGARATMRPYATSYEEAAIYYRALTLPRPGQGGPHDRGGFPIRGAGRTLPCSPEALRSSEQETQGWLQFETSELIFDVDTRNSVLDLMTAQGRNRACGFVGAFDALLRDGDAARVEHGIAELTQAALQRGVPIGRVVLTREPIDPTQLEDELAKTIESGMRLIALSPTTSELPYHGAGPLADCFFRAAERCGF
jgi:hypothetical protein